MKKFEEMTQEQLRYLRQKWSSEAIEIERDIVRSQSRLDKRVEKQDADKANISALEQDLNDAKGLLTHLQTMNSPAEFIGLQQSRVEALQTEFREAQSGLNVLTDEEAHMQQLSISELEQRKSLRETKIAELNLLIN